MPHWAHALTDATVFESKLWVSTSNNSTTFHVTFIYLLLLSFWAHVCTIGIYVWIHMQLCVHAHGRQRSVSYSIALTLSFEMVSLTGYWLAGHWVPGMHLSWSPHVTHCPSFYWGAGHLNSCHACTVDIFLAEPSPQPLSIFEENWSATILVKPNKTTSQKSSKYFLI